MSSPVMLSCHNGNLSQSLILPLFPDTSLNFASKHRGLKADLYNKKSGKESSEHPNE